LASWRDRSLCYRWDRWREETAPIRAYEGGVLIELIVTRDGEASEVHEIGKHLGFGLDESAITAVEQWCFKPGEKDGKPVPVISHITVRFRLSR
jgi:TonB family protein